MSERPVGFSRKDAKRVAETVRHVEAAGPRIGGAGRAAALRGTQEVWQVTAVNTVAGTCTVRRLKSDWTLNAASDTGDIIKYDSANVPSVGDRGTLLAFGDWGRFFFSRKGVAYDCESGGIARILPAAGSFDYQIPQDWYIHTGGVWTHEYQGLSIWKLANAPISFPLANNYAFIQSGDTYPTVGFDATTEVPLNVTWVAGTDVYAILEDFDLPSLTYAQYVLLSKTQLSAGAGEVFGGFALYATLATAVRYVGGQNMASFRTALTCSGTAVYGISCLPHIAVTFELQWLDGSTYLFHSGGGIGKVVQI